MTRDSLIEVREERPGDVASIRELNRLAFEQDQEGNIVDALRSNGGASLSLVATLNGRLVGHMTGYRYEVGRSGKPDIRTTDALERTLLESKSIAYAKEGAGASRIDEERDGAQRGKPEALETCAGWWRSEDLV